MVESKLVELVVAGSNPVGHPTLFWGFLEEVDFRHNLHETKPYIPKRMTARFQRISQQRGRNHLPKVNFFTDPPLSNFRVYPRSSRVLGVSGVELRTRGAYWRLAPANLLGHKDCE